MVVQTPLEMLHTYCQVTSTFHLCFYLYPFQPKEEFTFNRDQAD